MSELEQLNTLIAAILSTNNESRKESEALLAQTREQDFDKYILLFCNLLSNTPAQEVKLFCISHLRRQLSNFVDTLDTSLWHKLSVENQKYMKEFLFTTLTNEQNPKNLSLLADLIGEIGATIKLLDPEIQKVCSDEGRQWNDLMQNVWGLLNSGNAALVQSALQIMAILFVNCKNEYAVYKDELLPVFKQTLEHENLKVRGASIETLCAFLKGVESKHCKPFAELLPIVFNNLTLFVEKDEDMAIDTFAELEDLVQVEPKVFRKYIREYFNTIKSVVESKDVGISALKDTGLKSLTILAQRIPVIFKDNNTLLRELFEVYFTHMISSSEEPDDEWLTPPEGFVENNADESSSDATVKFVMSLINEVIEVLEEEQSLPILSGLVLQMVKVDNWKYQYSALMALSQVGEYVDDVAEIDPIIKIIIQFLESQHPKVRFAAIHCIGMIAYDMKGDFAARYYQDVIPILINLLNDSVQHVVGHNLSALTNIVESCSTEAIKPYITQILEPCINFLGNACSFVKENALTLISTVAKNSAKNFIPYWQKTAEIVFGLLNSANDKRYKGIRGHCIECLTLMGMGIGEEEFSKAAHEVITKMVEIQSSDLDEGDQQRFFLLAAWKRLCQIMRGRFAPYLENIVPSIFRMIDAIIAEEKKKKKNMADNEINDIKEALGMDDVPVEGDAREKLFYTTNTSDTQEIMVGVDMMNTFLKFLGKDYIPYVQRTSELLTFLINNSSNDEVRFAAAQALPEIIKVLQSSNEPDKEGLVSVTTKTYVNLLWQSQAEEFEAVNIATFIQAMKDVIMAGGRYMSQEEITIFSEKVIEALQKSDGRKADNQDELRNNHENYDEEEAEMINLENKNEEELQCALADLMGALFQSHKELTYPLVQFAQKELLPRVFGDNVSPIMNRFGLFLIDNMIEYLGLEHIPNEWPYLVKVLIEYCTAKVPDLRQAATYGIGVLAEKADGEGFKQVADYCLKALVSAIEVKKRDNEDKMDYYHAKDNAVSALGKIIKCQYANINLKETVQKWLTYLPLRHDKAEAKFMHELLVDIILESDANLVFGENGESLPKVMQTFAEIVDTKLASETFKEKMKKVVQMLMNNEASRPMLHEAVGKIDKKWQDKLQRVLGL